MKQPSLSLGALIGGITSIPLMALLYLGAQFATLPFVPFDLLDWMARSLPGNLVTAGIDGIVSLINVLNLGSTSEAAKSIEKAMAVMLFMAGGALLGAVIAWISRRSQLSGTNGGVYVGAFAAAIALLIGFSLDSAGNALVTTLWIGLLFAGWGGLVGYLLDSLTSEEPSEHYRASRRAALIKLAGGSAGLAIATWGLGRLIGAQPDDTGADVPLATVATPSAAAPALPETPAPDMTVSATARDLIMPAPGTRPELTLNDEFYRIDINARPPVLRKESWLLETAGLFDNPIPLTIEDLMSYPTVTQAITLSCISNRIGGDLIGTSNWTGLRLRDLLADLGLRPEARELLVEAADGFFESVVMDDVMDPRTLLVYGMNGQTLPIEHGFPLRIYIPNRYGMKQPKWITRIEARDEESKGYWVARGWSQEARPHVTSVIDSVKVDQPAADGSIPIGGIAWAGDRGIQRVELQFDGQEWVPAVLRTPPLSPLTWVQWRYDWFAEPGSHTIRVRATDGRGTLQIEQESGVRPNGATGYHSVKVNV